MQCKQGREGSLPKNWDFHETVPQLMRAMPPLFTNANHQPYPNSRENVTTEE